VEGGVKDEDALSLIYECYTKPVRGLLNGKPYKIMYLRVIIIYRYSNSYARAA
jgi:hypothetical protein